MARRKQPTNPARPAPVCNRTPRNAPGPLRVMVIGADGAALEHAEGAVRHAGGMLVVAQTWRAARLLLSSCPCDAAVVRAPLPDADTLAVMEEITAGRAGTPAVLLADAPTLEQAVGAMRAGASDVVRPDAPDLAARIAAAAERGRVVRAREARVARLRETCRTLNVARRQVMRQVGSLCDDMVEAFQDLTDQLADARVGGEFASQISQDLDVESLLRTALEFILAKTGPTNGAIFLPSTSRDFSVGAYVNYSCPRDTTEVLLDNLAAAVSPRMESEPGVRMFHGAAELEAFLGPAADWMGDAAAAMFSCRHEDECLAVVMLFRDKGVPFPQSLDRTLATIASIFGRQLARVVHVHHRHMPKDQWGALGDAESDSDDHGLAA